jgi:hypothetical protein
MPWQFSRGRKYWRQGLIRPYEFQDEFTIPDVNPLVTPRLAEPGPGMWNVVDLDGRLAVNLNALAISGAGSAAFDRTYLENPQPWQRHAGRFIEHRVTLLNAGNMRLGWQSAGGGLVADNLAVFEYDSTSVLKIRDEQGQIAIDYPYTVASAHHLRIYDTGTDFLFFLALHAAPTLWYPLWRKTASRSKLAHVYHAIQNKDQQFTLDWCRVQSHSQGWVPPPALHVVDPAPSQHGDSGADGLTSVTITTPASGTNELRFRYQDNVNHWRLVLNKTGGTLDLVKTVASVDTTVGTTSVTWTAGEPVILTALHAGSSIRTFYGRVAGTATTSSQFNTATGIGVGSAGTYRDLIGYAKGTHRL